jgi:dolichol-phosphate mannosyltransferase
VSSASTDRAPAADRGAASDRPDSMTDRPVLSAVVPMRNEADNVGPVLAELVRALDGLGGGPGAYEIVCVDDGSRDGTRRALLAAAARTPALVGLRHRRGSGQSAALLTGIRAARGEWIVTLDGDGQNDPADIPRLLAAARAGAAARDGDRGLMICGRRARRRDSLLRRVASRLANAVRATALGDRTPDTGCALKLFRRQDFLALPQFDHMHRFLPALMLRQGGRIVSIDVNHRPRVRGRSNYGVFDRLWVGIVDLLGVMWLMRRACRPELEPLAGAGLPAPPPDPSSHTERP